MRKRSDYSILIEFIIEDIVDHGAEEADDKTTSQRSGGIKVDISAGRIGKSSLCYKERSTAVPVKTSSLMEKFLKRNEQAVKVPRTDEAIAKNILRVTA